MNDQEYRYYIEKPLSPDGGDYFTICECVSVEAAIAVIGALLKAHDLGHCEYRVRVRRVL